MSKRRNRNRATRTPNPTGTNHPSLALSENGESNSLVEQRYEAIQAYSGPLPPPSDFAAYGDVVDDAPERILCLLEREQGHRHNLENWAVKGETVRSLAGVVFAFLIVIGAIGGGLVLVQNGFGLAGTLFAGAGLVSLITVFIYGTRHANQNK